MKRYKISVDMEPTYCNSIVRDGKKVDVYKHFGTLKCRVDSGNYTLVTAGWYDSAADAYSKLAEFYNKIKDKEAVVSEA